MIDERHLQGSLCTGDDQEVDEVIVLFCYNFFSSFLDFDDRGSDGVYISR